MISAGKAERVVALNFQLVWASQSLCALVRQNKCSAELTTPRRCGRELLAESLLTSIHLGLLSLLRVHLTSFHFLPQP